MPGSKKSLNKTINNLNRVFDLTLAFVHTATT